MFDPDAEKMVASVVANVVLSSVSCVMLLPATVCVLVFFITALGLPPVAVAVAAAPSRKGPNVTSALPPAATDEPVTYVPASLPPGAISCTAGRNADAEPVPSNDANSDFSVISCAPGTT